MIDPLIMGSQIFHFKRDSLSQEIFLFCPLPLFHLFRDVPDTLLGILTPSSTSKIHLGIDNLMPTPASAPDVILEKLNLSSAFRALGLEDIAWFPKPHILTWASIPNLRGVGIFF
jgi:hypothetical protein